MVVYPQSQHTGFTLIEITIVLTIIALVAAGILAGAEMINNARLLATTNQIQQMETSMAAFNLKYNCLPGDCATATNFFSTDSGGCPGGHNGDGTCNGNGNGYIEYYNMGTVTLNPLDESYRFWQQLALSGMWPGVFTGVRDPITGGITVGSNVPPTKYPGGAWSIYNGPLPWVLYHLNQNAVMFGQSTGGLPWGSLITPTDAYSIDTKIDDGLSVDSSLMFCGEMGEMHPDEPNPCVISYITGVYNATSSDKSCACVIKLNQ